MVCLQGCYHEYLSESKTLSNTTLQIMTSVMKSYFETVDRVHFYSTIYVL